MEKCCFPTIIRIHERFTLESENFGQKNDRSLTEVLAQKDYNEVIEEYAPDRTVLKLSFVKAGVKKVTEKSDRKKVTEKTGKQMEQILSQMQPNVDYKVEDAAMWLNVGRTRARTLLKMLVTDGKISETGATKMKRYRRTNGNSINIAGD